MGISIELLRKLINRKTLLVIIPMLILVESSVYFGIKTHKLSLELKKRGGDYEKFNKECITLRDAHVKTQNDYAKLQKDFEAISMDRENLLIQMKKNVADQNRLADIEASYEQLKNDNISRIAEIQTLTKQNTALKEQVKALGTIKKQLLKEKEQLQDALVKEKANSGIAGLEQQNASLTAHVKQLSDEAERLKRNQSTTVSQSQATINKLQENENKLKAQVSELQLREKELTKKYAQAVQKTKSFEKKVAAEPAKVTEIARQNKALIRDTSNMHYNMGVFYLKQKEYSRAAAEFEKAIELTPDDAYSHFNLGYIYAEYLVNRKKAVEHFRQYLRLAKSDDKDVDWVKKYILTWETWGGKEPME